MFSAPQLKLACQPEFSAYLRGDKVMPINVEIFPTGYCNAKCPTCFFEHKHSGAQLQPGPLLRALDEMHAMGVRAVTWSGGGEPSLHPDLGMFIIRCRIQQGMFTNAIAPITYDASLLKWVRVTLSPADIPADNFFRLRDCNYVTIGVNYTGDKSEVYRAIDLCQRYSLDGVVVKPALAEGNVASNIAYDLDDIEYRKLSVMRYKFNDQYTTFRGYDRCEGFHFVMCIQETGDITTCQYQKCDALRTVGSIYDDQGVAVLRKLPKYITVGDGCQLCCKNHEVNKLIHSAHHVTDRSFV